MAPTFPVPFRAFRQKIADPANHGPKHFSCSRSPYMLNKIDPLISSPNMLLTTIILVSTIGFFILLKNFIFVLKWIFVILLRPSKDLKRIYGSWALIIGSTDGIGKAFAFKLAEKDSYPEIEIKIFKLDFSEGDVVSRFRVMGRMIEGLDIGVLINNVGVTYPGAMYFHEVDEKIWMNLVRVNVQGTSYVTKVVLKGMVARRRGAIVNMGSGASVVPSHPLYAIYSATKGYVDQLSRSLYVKYKQYGIDVQCQVYIFDF
ncbi:17 beta-hydroxysteroid dehydrogenase type 3, HSD17B3 [Handroanthus impetiginosus]|uniref:17 beta-hydroxysteroid dehydrogenase type 3, HSD17B3 n=1 Tax=Handroanthus impetiginosus TaxID=429701 RepID=A0A2G9HJT7_9LAMI|nr:17 beta-hydroxysteroid dehydrogenase type 3, HSD17B3 [Handroanthus impetiginosus]